MRYRIFWKEPYAHAIYDSDKGQVAPLYHNGNFVTLEEAIALLVKNEPVMIDVGVGAFTSHRNVVDISPIYKEAVNITIDRGYTLEGKASCSSPSVKCPYLDTLENGKKFCKRLSKVIQRDKTYKHYVPAEKCPVWAE
jgi:hypothetical protein